MTERSRLEGERRDLRNQLRTLQSRYTSAHPEVVDAAARLKRVEDQLKVLPPDPPVTAESQDNSAVTVRLQLLDGEAKRLGEEQKRISAQMGVYRAKVDAVPVREQEMAELNRNYSVSKDHYQSLLDKTFSAGMAADLERKQQSEHFTILDSALVPEKPFKPNRRAMLMAAFLGALFTSLPAVARHSRSSAGTHVCRRCGAGFAGWMPSGSGAVFEAAPHLMIHENTGTASC